VQRTSPSTIRTVTWLLIAAAVLALGVVLWRLDRRMERTGIGSDPVAGNPYVGQTSSPKTNDTPGSTL